MIHHDSEEDKSVDLTEHIDKKRTKEMLQNSQSYESGNGFAQQSQSSIVEVPIKTPGKNVKPSKLAAPKEFSNKSDSA